MKITAITALAACALLAEIEPVNLHAQLDETQARHILAQAFPTPTPFQAPAEITSAGNVAFPGRPLMVCISGETPINLLPLRCRPDFAKLPAHVVFACMPDDRLWRKATGLP